MANSPMQQYRPSFLVTHTKTDDSDEYISNKEQYVEDINYLLLNDGGGLLLNSGQYLLLNG